MNRTTAIARVAGHDIFTILTGPAEPSGRLVIMAHGFRGSSIGPARTFVNFERLLLAGGFSCLRFDQPGSGNSPGDFAESSFATWVDVLAELALRFLDRGHRVALLGQSMGATATMVAAGRPSLRDRIPCVLLWVPGPVSDFVDLATGGIEEEEGQRYDPRFWSEARDARFFDALETYPGGVHLVYGDRDRYVSDHLRSRVIEAVRPRGAVLVLEDEDHSPWRWDSAQRVFREQAAFLDRYLPV